MNNIIIIPARMGSQRFPNKPMALIDGTPMIQRVWQQAKLADIGSVIVACCENEVFDLITSVGGEAVMTDPSLPSGTDRIFQTIKKSNNFEQFDNIINLQGDMPIINPLDIKKVILSLNQGYDIGTLVTNINLKEEMDKNITKAKVNWISRYENGQAIDFYKISKKNIENIYHHVGIYSFTYKSLKKFVELEQSQNEINLKLEQLRAIDAKMKIGVSFVEGVPMSVDTEEDLIKVENIIKDNQ